MSHFMWELSSTSSPSNAARVRRRAWPSRSTRLVAFIAILRVVVTPLIFDAAFGACGAFGPSLRTALRLRRPA